MPSKGGTGYFLDTINFSVCKPTRKHNFSYPIFSSTDDFRSLFPVILSNRDASREKERTAYNFFVDYVEDCACLACRVSYTRPHPHVCSSRCRVLPRGTLTKVLINAQ
jgi:hypothetical protein